MKAADESVHRVSTTLDSRKMSDYGTKNNGRFIDSNTTNKRFSPLLRQTITASAPILTIIVCGMTTGYSSVLLPQLQNDSSLSIDPLTKNELSWIASIAVLPMIPGCLIGGYIMAKYGRRYVHKVLCSFLIIGWLSIGLAVNTNYLLVGRILTGFCVGLSGPSASVYIGEISETKYRGVLLSGISLSISLGILFIHILGTFLHWKLTAIICVIISFLAYLLVSLVPESPSWLVSKNRTNEAKAAFFWLRGCLHDDIKEFEDMVQKHDMIQIEGNEMGVCRKLMINLRKPEFYKPLIIILIFFSSMQLSGVNCIAFYTVALMKNVLGNDLNEYLSMIILDIFRVFTSIVAGMLLKVMYRRTLTFTSGLGTAICLITLATFMHLSKDLESSSSITVISLLFLVLYIFFIGCGLFCIPWVLNGEMFPAVSRSFGSAITSSFNFFVFFVVVKTGPDMFEILGVAETFMIYGVLLISGLIALWFLLPETKGKSLQEIEEFFKK